MGSAVVVEIGGVPRYVHTRAPGGLPPGALTFSASPPGLCDVALSPDGRSLVVTAPMGTQEQLGSIEMTWTPTDGSPHLMATVPVAITAASASDLDWVVS